MKSLIALLCAATFAQDTPRRRVSAEYLAVVRQIEQMRKTKPPSCSTGEPNRAALRDAAELPKKGWGYKVANPDRKTNFGTDEMVFGLMLQGAEMAERYGTDGTFHVYDIGHKEGGKLSPHISHQGGRDVDLGFYICDDKGRSQGNRIVDIDKEGKAKSGNLRFDLERNWTFVCTMIDNPYFGENIRFIILAEWVQDLLTKYARDRMLKSRIPAEREYLEKHLKLAEKYFTTKNDHDNHYHLRLKCTREDAKEG